MDDCIFCKIVAGEVPAAKVYEDADVLAFLTIEAINPGHTLVIPKRHIESVWDMEDDLYSKNMDIVKKISVALDVAFNPEKVGVMVSGWDVSHAHVHVVPMEQSGDITSIKLIEGVAFKFDQNTLKTHADKIKQSLS